MIDRIRWLGPQARTLIHPEQAFDSPTNHLPPPLDRVFPGVVGSFDSTSLQIERPSDRGLQRCTYCGKAHCNCQKINASGSLEGILGEISHIHFPFSDARLAVQDPPQFLLHGEKLFADKGYCGVDDNMFVRFACFFFSSSGHSFLSVLSDTTRPQSRLLSTLFLIDRQHATDSLGITEHRSSTSLDS